ncbi:MAG TPA: hypothetical protein PK677_17360 [Acidiphilium sp.]|nr:hypothetical protein [Acidiphilium sp.]
MPDYQCYPLWEASPGIVGNINPNDLPISKILAERLNKWASQFDATFDLEDPASSGFQNEYDRLVFRALGYELAKELGGELGQGYSVILKF